MPDRDIIDQVDYSNCTLNEVLIGPTLTVPISISIAQGQLASVYFNDTLLSPIKFCATEPLEPGDLVTVETRTGRVIEVKKGNTADTSNEANQ